MRVWTDPSLQLLDETLNHKSGHFCNHHHPSHITLPNVKKELYYSR